MTPALRAHGAMLLYSLLISASFSIGDRITAALDPKVLTLERFCIGAAAFLLIAARRPSFGRPSGKTLARGFLLGASMTLYFVLMFEALRFTDAVTTGALFTTLPLMSAGVARVLVGQRTALSQVGWMLLGAGGALVVVFDGELARILRLDLGLGAWIFLAGTFAFAFYSPLVRRLHGGDDLIVMTFWTLLCSAVLLVFLAGPAALATDWGEVGPEVHLGIAYLGVVNTAVTFWLAKVASTVLPSAKVMAYTYLTPVFVVGLEVILGRGWPSPGLLVGLAIATGATVAFLRSADRPAAGGSSRRSR